MGKGCPGGESYSIPGHPQPPKRSKGCNNMQAGISPCHPNSQGSCIKLGTHSEVTCSPAPQTQAGTCPSQTLRCQGSMRHAKASDHLRSKRQSRAATVGYLAAAEWPCIDHALMWKTDPRKPEVTKNQLWTLQSTTRACKADDTVRPMLLPTPRLVFRPGGFRDSGHRTYSSGSNKHRNFSLSLGVLIPK